MAKKVTKWNRNGSGINGSRGFRRGWGAEGANPASFASGGRGKFGKPIGHGPNRLSPKPDSRVGKPEGYGPNHEMPRPTPGYDKSGAFRGMRPWGGSD